MENTVDKKFLEIGKIVGTHGLKGELRVDPWCDSPDFLCQFTTLYVKKGKEKIKVKSKPHKRIVIMKISGVETIEQADMLRNSVLYIDRNDAVLDDGVFFIQDIMGLSVFDVDTNEKYGKITDIIKTGANDVYQITNDNKENFLIPVIDEVVVEVDTEKGIFIKPMKGLFGDED